VPKPSQPGLFASAAPAALEPDDGERLAALRLIRTAQIGPVTFHELLSLFGGAAAALRALPELQRRAGRSIKVCPEADAERELAAADKIGARPLFSFEAGYPAALATIEAPPPLVYVRGRAELFSRPALAIVGSRQASAAGIKLARHFARELSAAGLVIVSGLARGIDGAAHEASLAAGTIAVLAGGADVVYPPEHAALQARIGEEGCLVTEQPPGFTPRGKDFPRRNRLISGLSRGVLVIEAARRSGTLVTARFAGEQGREVFAVPGHPLDPRAEGTNQLLKSGATLVTEADDVLEALAPQLAQGGGMTEPAGAAHPAATNSDARYGTSPLGNIALPDTQARARVLAALGPHPVDIDEVGRATALSAREVRALLMELDLAGEIERHGFQLVSLAAKDG
jgi:DNA processing protein